MRCEEAQQRMAAFVVDDLPTELSERLIEHLGTCPTCRFWHQETLSMLQVWEEGNRPIPELDLVPAVMERIDCATPAKKSGSSKFTFLCHYGIAASLAFGLFYFGVFEHVGVNISRTIDHLSEKVMIVDRHESAQ